MAIPDMQVMAIRSEGRAAWTVVTVEFQWLDSDYQGDGQWPDAAAPMRTFSLLQEHISSATEVRNHQGGRQADLNARCD